MSDGEVAGRSLEELGRLAGAYCAIERRLFEIMGEGSVRADGPPEAAALLSSASLEHAWHAEVWADRLPVLASVDRAALATVPEPVEALLDVVAKAAPLDQLVGLFRVVVPRLVVGYASHEAAASPVSEAPTRRALRLVLADEREESVAGETLLGGLLTTAGALEAARITTADLEGRLLDAGLRRGLVPAPRSRA